MIKLKVHPKDMDESYLIQKAAFAAGYQWCTGDKALRRYPLYWITFRPEEKELRHAQIPRFTNVDSFIEKSVAEILHMLGAHYGIDCTIPEET